MPENTRYYGNLQSLSFANDGSSFSAVSRRNSHGGLGNADGSRGIGLTGDELRGEHAVSGKADGDRGADADFALQIE